MNSALLLSIAVLGVIALIIGGIVTLRRNGAGDRTRGLLMLVMAVVLLGNVLIIAWPH